jgi:hypothetical protein
VERLKDFDDQTDDTGRGIELAALLALGAGELAEEVFVDEAEGIVVEAGWDLRNLLEQLLEQNAGEDLIGFRKHAGELRVVLLDVAHRLVYVFADVGTLGAREEILEAGVGREVEDACGVVGRGVVRAWCGTAGRYASLLQLSAARNKTYLCKAQEDEP